MFSNSFEICEILNMPEISLQLDIMKNLDELFNKYKPEGIFNQMQEEFHLKISYDNKKKILLFWLKRNAKIVSLLKRT